MVKTKKSRLSLGFLQVSAKRKNGVLLNHSRYHLTIIKQSYIRIQVLNSYCFLKKSVFAICFLRKSELRQVFSLKGSRKMVRLSKCPSYPGYDLSGVFWLDQNRQIQGGQEICTTKQMSELPRVRVNRILLYKPELN